MNESNLSACESTRDTPGLNAAVEQAAVCLCQAQRSDSVKNTKKIPCSKRCRCFIADKSVKVDDVDKQGHNQGNSRAEGHTGLRWQ